MTVEFKFEPGDHVKVRRFGIVGFVDMVGLSEKMPEPRVLVEWVDEKGTVNSRWFEESQLVLHAGSSTAFGTQ